jgi:hypothetical protein
MNKYTVPAAAATEMGGRDRHPETCPTCGQVLVPEGLRLPPIKRRILEAVQRRPDITTEALRCVVWVDDPNGGPEDRKCLHVHIAQLNRLLAPSGIMVRSAGGGYRVRSLDKKL